MIEFNKIVDTKSGVEGEPYYDDRGECGCEFCGSEAMVVIEKCHKLETIECLRLDKEKQDEDSTCGSYNCCFCDIWFDDV